MIINIINKVNVATEKQLGESLLLKIFNLLNASHFNGELTDCRIKWSDRIGVGKHSNRLFDFTVFEDKQFQPVIRLSKNLLKASPSDKIAQSLFHSMVHIWLWQNKLPWGHTLKFQEKTKIFDFSLIEAQLQN